SGALRGRGQDRRSSSATQAVIRYRLLPVDRQSTRVELNVGYRLTGTLAQFSRSDLVQDIASRLIALFAQNLEARLTRPEETARPAAELKAIPLLFSALMKWTGGRLTRLFTRGERHLTEGEDDKQGEQLSPEASRKDRPQPRQGRRFPARHGRYSQRHRG